MLERISELDVEFLNYINTFSVEKYDFFWLYATNTITWIPLFLFILYLIYTKFNRREVVVILVSIFIALSVTLLFTGLIKEIFMRVRPNNDFEVSRFLRVLEAPVDYSFFSGHASNSMVVSTLIVFYLKHKIKWAYIFFLWPVIFSFSRLYICVHYPSDIIAGLLMGFILGSIVYWIAYKRFFKG